MVYETGKTYFCAICGTFVEITKSGESDILCCGQKMEEIASDRVPQESEETTQRWRCNDCDYRVAAESPPETCPSCNEKCDFIDDSQYVPALARKGELFSCRLCGSQAKYLYDGGGILNCCAEKMCAEK